MAEIPEFFLQGQNFSTIASSENGDPSFGNAVSGTFYGMRIKMYRSRQGPNPTLLGFDGQGVTVPQALRGVSRHNADIFNASAGSNFQMYSRPSAFGAPTWGLGGVGEYFYLKSELINVDYHNLQSVPTVFAERASDSTEGWNTPYTPPYYDGEGWCDVLFRASSTKKYTLDEILSQVKSFPYYTRFWWNGINDALRDLTGYNRPAGVDGSLTGGFPSNPIARGMYWSYSGDREEIDGPYKNYKTEFGCPWPKLIFETRKSRLSKETVGPYPTWVPEGPNFYTAGSGYEHNPIRGQRFPLDLPLAPGQVAGFGGTLPSTFSDWGDQRYTDGWWQLSGAYAGPPTLKPLSNRNLVATDNPDRPIATKSIALASPFKTMLGLTVGPSQGMTPSNTSKYPFFFYGPQHPYYINSNAMQLNSSLNLFTKGTVRKEDLTGDLSRIKRDVATSATNDSQARWIIQSKFETPLLNFNKYRDGLHPQQRTMTMPSFGAAQVPRGMWHQYGSIPSGSNEGVFLQVTDIPFSWLKGALGVSRSKRKVKSLADLVGFSKKPVRLGQVASAKQIGELVVAIPFIEREGVRVFFTIPRRDVDQAVFGLNHERSPGVYIDSSGGRMRPPMVGRSVLDQIRMMRKYVFPPSMDFVRYKEILPFAAYCFEFKHNFSKQDLADIWQNIPPTVGTEFKAVTATINHQLLAKDLLGGGSDVVENTAGSGAKVFDMNEPGPGLDPQTQWMVFKCKQRAATNYYDKVLTKKGTTQDTKEFKLENVKVASVGTDEDISFNWPYDYFSLVELVKIDATVVLADLQPESEQPIPKPKKKSIERRKKRRKKKKIKRRGWRLRKLRDKAKKWWQKRDTREERQELRKERRKKRKDNRKKRKDNRKKKRSKRKSKRKNK